MNIEAAPTIKNPPAQFAGDLWVDMIAAPHTADQRMTVAVVRFRPGAPHGLAFPRPRLLHGTHRDVRSGR